MEKHIIRRIRCHLLYRVFNIDKTEIARRVSSYNISPAEFACYYISDRRSAIYSDICLAAAELTECNISQTCDPSSIAVHIKNVFIINTTLSPNGDYHFNDCIYK